MFDGSHVDYRLNLDYQWTPTLMTYAGWSTGFKGGGVSPRPYYPQQVVSFGTESVKSTEAGIKSQWFDNRVRANLAAFYEDYYGYQASANLPNLCVDKAGNLLQPPYNSPCGEYINAANAVGKGIEAEFELHPVDHLMVDASYSYLDLKFIQSLSPAVPVGGRVPNIGKNRGSVGVQYEATLANYGSLTPRVDASYWPAFCGDLLCNANVKNDAYTLLNGRLTYWAPKRGWSLALQVTNMTNKVYYLTKSNTGAGYISGQIGEPRLWAMTLNKQF